MLEINQREEVMTRQEAMDKAREYFDEGYACSQSIVLTFSEAYGLDDQMAKRIASVFGGGMGRLRQKCGAVTGGFMVLGLQFGNTEPRDMQSKLLAYSKVRELNQRVEEAYGTSNCFELLKRSVSDAEIRERIHHQRVCRYIVYEVAGWVYDILRQSETAGITGEDQTVASSSSSFSVPGK